MLKKIIEKRVKEEVRRRERERRQKELARRETERILEQLAMFVKVNNLFQGV